MMRRFAEVVCRGFMQLALAVALVTCGSSSNNGGAGGGGGLASGSGGALGSGEAGGSGGATCRAAGSLQVTASGMTAYVIDGDSNPTLTFCRGRTYAFVLNASGHPFYLKTVQGAGTANAYDSGITGNGTDVGTVTFAVPADAPATLFYDCSIHAPMTGTIHVVD